MLNKIHNAGVLAGVALKPSTPLSTVEYVLEKCDSVLLMLINPGYASSKNETQVSYTHKKIVDLKNMITERNLAVKIEIDGRISTVNIEKYGKEIVDIFVCGTTCIKRADIKNSVAGLFTLRKSLLA
jgi:ribulose-phosphate 3-epimerase